MTEKLLPIVPGCLALVTSNKGGPSEYNCLVGTEVTCVKRDMNVIPDAWVIDSKLCRHLGGDIGCHERDLMRIDGGKTEPSYVAETLLSNGDIAKVLIDADGAVYVGRS